MTRLSFLGGPWDGAEFRSELGSGECPSEVQLAKHRTVRFGGDRAVDPRLADLTVRDFPAFRHVYHRALETPERALLVWRPR